MSSKILKKTKFFYAIHARCLCFVWYVSCCHSIIHSFVQCSVIHTHTRLFMRYTLIYNNVSEWGVVSGVCEIFCFEEKPFFPLSVSPATNEWRKQIAKSYTVVVVTFTASFFYGRTLSFTQIRFFTSHTHANSKTAVETKPKREESSFPVSVHFAQNKMRKRKTRRSYRTGHLYTAENGVQCTTIK